MDKNLQDNMLITKKMVKASFNTKMELYLREFSKMTEQMVMENWWEEILVMKEILLMEWKMEKVFFLY